MTVPIKSYVNREAILIPALNASINLAYTWTPWRSLDPLTPVQESGVTNPHRFLKE